MAEPSAPEPASVLAARQLAEEARSRGVRRPPPRLLRVDRDRRRALPPTGSEPSAGCPAGS